MSDQELVKLLAQKEQLDKDMLAWHGADTDGDYAMYFKNEGDRLLEAIAELEL